jgi:hypothetical protein
MNFDVGARRPDCALIDSSASLRGGILRRRMREGLIKKRKACWVFSETLYCEGTIIQPGAG